jgi:hypothetical protein
MNIPAFLRRAGNRTMASLHLLSANPNHRSICQKRLATLRPAAWRTVEALEQRVLLSFTVSGSSNLSSIVGQSWTGTAATVTLSHPSGTGSGLSASIAWGDGQTDAGTIVSLGSGIFDVTDSRVFNAAGTFTAVVTVDGARGSSATADDSISVALPAITVNGPADFSLPEDAAFSNVSFGSILGFVPGGIINYAATSFASLTIDSSGNITGSGTAPSAGTYAGETVSVTESSNGQSDAATSSPFTMTITPAPLTANSTSISAYAGIPWTGTVATFTDADPAAQAGWTTLGDYSATIFYAGTSATGTLSSNGGGSFSVAGTLDFPVSGSCDVTVSISDTGGATATADDSASVNLAGFSLSAPTITIEQGQSYSGSVGQIVDPAGANSNASWFAGSLSFDGWIYPVALTSGGAGTWDVEASALASLPAGGDYSGSLSIIESDGNQMITPSPATIAIDVIPPSLYASGVFINATVAQPWSGTVASVADDDPYDLPNSYYTASTNYNDQTSPTAGQISGGSGSDWTVSDTHTFTAPGSFMPSTTVYNQYNNVVASASSTATVNLAGISVSPSYISIAEEQPFDGDVATLSDSAGYDASGNYDGTFTLAGPGGTTTYSNLSFAAQGDGNYAVAVNGLPVLSAGSYSGTLSVSESFGSQSVSAATSVPIDVSDVPPSANGVGSISANLGQSWEGTVATFTDIDPTAVAADFTETTAWGDGNTSTGTISSDGSGGFIVADNHVFSSAGTFYPTVTVTDDDNGAATVTDTASVGLPAISVVSPGNVSLQENQSISNLPLGASMVTLPAPRSPTQQPAPSQAFP